MIRYILSKRDRVVLWSCGAVRADQGQKVAEFHPTDRERYYVDILEEDEFWYKIRVHKPDGDIVVGWITKHFEGLIELTNRHELLDGRFNSDRVA